MMDPTPDDLRDLEDLRTVFADIVKGAPGSLDGVKAMSTIKRLDAVLPQIRQRVSQRRETDRAGHIERGTAAGQVQPPSLWDKVKAVASTPPLAETIGNKFMMGTLMRPEFARTPEDAARRRDEGESYPRAEADRLFRAHPEVKALKDVGDAVRTVAAIPMGGMAGMATEAALASRAAKLAPYVGDAVAGAVGTAASEVGTGKDGGEIAEDTLAALGPSAALGKAFRMIGGGSGRVAEAIKNSKTTTGEDIRILDEHGYVPSPTPTRPVTRKGSSDPQPYGPQQAPSPSRAQDVMANPHGRGQSGARSATEFSEELDVRDRFRKQRLFADRDRHNAPGGEGTREVSVESAIQQVDGELANPRNQMHPGVMSALKRAKAMFEGRLEPTQDIWTSHSDGGQHGSVEGVTEKLAEPFNIEPPATVRYHENKPIPVEVPEPDPDYGTHKRVPYEPFPTPGREPVTHDERRLMYRGGNRVVSPPGPEEEVYRPLPKHIQTVEPEYTVHAERGDPIRISEVEHPGFHTRQTSVQPSAEKVTVGMGDIRGRVGRGEWGAAESDAPNHIRTINEIDLIRDALDEASNVAAQKGFTQTELPFGRLSNHLRHDIVKKHAPAVGFSNRRSAAVKSKNERMEARMKDDAEIPESFAMQLKAQGEAGSGHAGVRSDRLKTFGKQFPPSSRMPKEKIKALMDAPRLLLAEERLKLKSLPRIGAGGNDKLNLAEPVIGRGVYPAARGVEWLAKNGGPSHAAATYGALGPERSADAAKKFAINAGTLSLLPYFALQQLRGGQQRRD